MIHILFSVKRWCFSSFIIFLSCSFLNYNISVNMFCAFGFLSGLSLCSSPFPVTLPKGTVFLSSCLTWRVIMNQGGLVHVLVGHEVPPKHAQSVYQHQGVLQDLSSRGSGLHWDTDTIGLLLQKWCKFFGLPECWYNLTLSDIRELFKCLTLLTLVIMMT